MSARRRLIVSYQSTPDLSIWQRIQPDFVAQLPLRNLHWKTTSRSLRTIQTLEIDLRAFQTLPAEQAQQIPPSLLERPYLHLLFVACDDNDAYRSSIRQQIRDWLDAVAIRRNQEWLIVHVAASRLGPAKFYQRKGTVVDKIKVDFNVGKRDRVAQLSLDATGSAEDPVLWAELISKIKDSVITTFDANVIAFEEDVRKLDSQRALPGWNFCMFFIQKEGLALSFEAMNLLEDALIQYDELEASFFQSLNENTLVWFGKSGGTAQGDDSLNLFSANAKPYRQLIMNNTISLFDFRLYLFARQGSLLGRLGRSLEIARRGTEFIASLGLALRQEQSLIDDDFVAAWTFSAATQIVEHCDRSMAEIPATDSHAHAYHAVRAELLELACKQLEKIGVAHNMLPDEEPFNASSDEPASARPLVSTHGANGTEKTPTSQIVIKSALENPAMLHQHIETMLTQVIADYGASGRQRSALRAQARLAAHDLLRQRRDVALRRLQGLPPTYLNSQWSRLGANILETSSRIQDANTGERDRLLTMLSLLRAGVTAGSPSWSVCLANTAETSEQLAKRFLAATAAHSKALEKVIALPAFPCFAVQIVDESGRHDVEGETSSFDIIVSNKLPCDFICDEIRLRMSTPDSEHVWFRCTPSKLSSGTSRLTCTSLSNVSGYCRLDIAQIRAEKVVFQYDHRPPALSSSQRGPTANVMQPCVHFALDPFAVRFRFLDTPAVPIAERRSVILRISTGRTEVIQASLSLETVDNIIVFDVAAAQAEGLQLVSEENHARLHLRQLARFQHFDVEVPFSVQTNAPQIEVFVEMRYTTPSSLEPTRRARAVLPLILALPLTVSVQDHFRQDKALSVFTVSSGKEGGLRIDKVDIQGASAKFPQRQDVRSAVILPDSPACFAFGFPLELPRPIEPHPLVLTLRYRCIQDEIIEVISRALQSKAASHSARLLPILEDVAGALARQCTNLDDYIFYNRLSLPSFHWQRWHHQLVSLYGDIDLNGEVLSLIENISETQSLSTSGAQYGWRTLRIPVDKPSMSVVCQTSVVLPPGTNRLVAGELVTANIEIKVFFSWAADRSLFDQLKSVHQRLVYDVSLDDGDWVVAGKKKGEFAASDGYETSIQLHLVPLRVGRLSLPRVMVFSVPTDAATHALPAVETYQANAARHIDVAPSEIRSTFSVDL